MSLSQCASARWRSEHRVLELSRSASGAFAFASVAVGRLVVGRAKIRHLEIGDLVVNRLRVTDSLEIPGD